MEVQPVARRAKSASMYTAGSTARLTMAERAFHIVHSGNDH